MLIQRKATSLHSLLVPVVLDFIVDMPRLPVDGGEGPEAAAVNVVKEVVPLCDARGTLGSLRWDGTLNMVT